MNVGAEIVNAFLSIHQLTQAANKTISLVFTVIALIRQFHFVATLNSFGYNIWSESLCESKKFTALFLDRFHRTQSKT